MMVVDEGTREEIIQYVIAPDLQIELRRHEGKWVAITPTELIGEGDSAEEVIRLASERGIADPILYFVPRDGDTTFFF